MTASLMIVEATLPVPARSCFIAGPPRGRPDPSVQATSLASAARWEIGVFAYFEGRQDAGSDCRRGNGRVDDGAGAAPVRCLRIGRYLRANEGAQHRRR